MIEYQKEVLGILTQYVFEGALDWATGQQSEYWDTLYSDYENVYKAAITVIYDYGGER